MVEYCVVGAAVKRSVRKRAWTVDDVSHPTDVSVLMASFLRSATAPDIKVLTHTQRMLLRNDRERQSGYDVNVLR